MSVVNKEARRNRLFEQRFNELRGDMSIAAFAKTLGMSSPTIGFYENGNRLPNASDLLRIATIYGVSADWLLGLSEVKAPDATVQSVCAYTGLTEESIDILHSAQVCKTVIESLNIMLDFINKVISSNVTPLFSEDELPMDQPRINTKLLIWAESTLIMLEQIEQLTSLETRELRFRWNIPSLLTELPVQIPVSLSTIYNAQRSENLKQMQDYICKIVSSMTNDDALQEAVEG